MEYRLPKLKIKLIMKKRIIKIYDKIIVALLGITGFFTACTDPYIGGGIAEYGVPHADFEIKGVVKNRETGEAIDKIRVIRQERDYPEYGDTIYTDGKGEYRFEFYGFPYEENKFKLKIEDIDGGENGGDFVTKELEIVFTNNDKVENSSGWYEGKYKKTIDIELDKKEGTE